jgi:flavin-binding protein dodecin
MASRCHGQGAGTIGGEAGLPRHLGWFEVVQVRGAIEGSKVGRYQVTLKVGFTLE